MNDILLFICGFAVGIISILIVNYQVWNNDSKTISTTNNADVIR